MKVLTPIFLIFIIQLVSCSKKEIDKPNNSNSVSQDDKTYEILNIDWVLSSGLIYMDNMNTNEKIYYDHFSSSKPISFLDPINGAAIPFDSIIRGYTTWRFTNDSYFFLNNSLNYEFTKYDNTLSIIGMEGGTARPVTIVDISEKHLIVKVNEDFAIVPGDASYNFHSILTFVKSGETCSNCNQDIYYDWSYGGVINFNTGSTSNGNNSTDIIGTQWVVKRVLKNFANEYPLDTLYFNSNNTYRINGGNERNYNLSQNIGSNTFNLSLYSFLTLGGDYSTNIINTFISDGEINGASFKPILSNSNEESIVWIEKIN